MIYGKYTPFVDEVVGFVEYGRLLQSIHSTVCTLSLISNYEEAKFFAWERTCGLEGYLWTDIRELEMAKVHENGYKTAHLVDGSENPSVLLQRFSQILRERLDGRYLDLLDDITSDLYNCAVNRMINGNGNAFFEHMFAGYSAGGWVCGWNGNYPDGEMAIFFPDS